MVTTLMTYPSYLDTHETNILAMHEAKFRPLDTIWLIVLTMIISELWPIDFFIQAEFWSSGRQSDAYEPTIHQQRCAQKGVLKSMK